MALNWDESTINQNDLLQVTIKVLIGFIIIYGVWFINSTMLSRTLYLKIYRAKADLQAFSLIFIWIWLFELRWEGIESQVYFIWNDQDRFGMVDLE